MAKKKIKVILLEDIPEIGNKFETAEVTSGYFRNYLSPNGLVELATEKTLARLEKQREKAEKERRERITESEKKAEKLKGQNFTFPVRVGEKNQVYGSVTKEDIAEKLAEEEYENISVNLHHPLKELGEREVVVDFGDEVTVPIKIILEKEK